jgi:hypothetical protein
MKYQLILSYLSLLLLVTSCQEAADRTPNSAAENLVIRPGESVGPITASMDAEKIKEVYGEKNVREEEIYIAEGESQSGLTIFPGTPREIEVVLNADGSPQFVRISREQTPWRTPDGVQVGTSLEDLQRINGKAFTFNGFQWDYGGLVTDWKGGQLDSSLIIALTPGDYDALPDDMLGEVVLSSDDPRMRDLDLRVGSMVVTF